MPAPITLLHGVATTAAIWDRVLPLVSDLDVRAIERPKTGDLEQEVAHLAPLVEDTFVVGVSGGATLVLALAASAVHLTGGIAHEPAVGSLLPDLLAPMAAAFAERGVQGFGKLLYGPSWSIGMAGPDTSAVGRELAMFRAFEPTRRREGQGPVVTTVGSQSPAIRHAASAALNDRLHYPVLELTGCSHFVQWDEPATLAMAIRRIAAGL